MLEKVITYKDPFTDENVSETFYFNITPAEMLDIEARYNGSIMSAIKRVLEGRNLESIIEIFKYLIAKSYGERMVNSNRFVKSKEATEAFLASDAYSELMFELLDDKDSAKEFFEHVFPDREKVRSRFSNLLGYNKPNAEEAADAVVE